MPKVDEIKQAIEALPKEDYVQLRRWFSEKDWREWDGQIASDSESGKLDFLTKEALDAKAQGHKRSGRSSRVSRGVYPRAGLRRDKPGGSLMHLETQEPEKAKAQATVWRIEYIETRTPSPKFLKQPQPSAQRLPIPLPLAGIIHGM